MGANKCLVGPRDVAEHLLPAAAKFVMDPSPVTRFYGRSIFYAVQSHPQFEKLMRKYILPGTYRNIHGVLESLKRRVSFLSCHIPVTDLNKFYRAPETSPQKQQLKLDPNWFPWIGKTSNQVHITASKKLPLIICSSTLRTVSFSSNLLDNFNNDE